MNQLLKGFTYPKKRETDIGWLIRNLPIRNSENPKLAETLEKLKRLRRNSRALECRELSNGVSL